MLKETGDRWVSLARQAKAASPDLKDPLAAMAAPDLKASWDLPALGVPRESRAKQVLQVLLALLDPLAPLASRWATTLLLWLPFLDRVRPR